MTSRKYPFFNRLIRPSVTITIALTAGVFLTAAYRYNLFGLNEMLSSTWLSVRAERAYHDERWGYAGILYASAANMGYGPVKMQYNLANAYYKQGRYAEAEKLYERLLAQKGSGNTADIWNNLGNTYYRLGFIVQSFEAYKQALLINDEDATIRQNFLFVATRLQAMFRQEGGRGKKKDDKQAEGERKKDNRPDDKQGDPDKDNNAQLPYQVSDKQMDNMLTTAKEQEHVPKGSKSSKDTNKSRPAGPDY